MATTHMDLREKVPVNIVKGARLESTMNELFSNFEAGEQRNADLVNKFFDQTYFRGEESLINKFTEIKTDLKFDDIEKEGINLALLLYNDGMYDLKLHLDKVTNDNIKKAFIQKIFNEVQAKIGGGAPYTNFAVDCAVTAGDTNVIGYFQKVADYLKDKENATNGKKTVEVLKDIIITNHDLNSTLPLGEQIPAGVNLTDPSVPANTKHDFDTLLSFEIGKEADRTISIAKDFSKDFQKLLTNSLPAINTIVGENEEYRYDEGKLGSEYQGRLQLIKDDRNLSEAEKNEQINNLRREYYIKYLKTRNAKIGNALEQLYNNDFDYSKVDSNVLKDYFDKVVDIRLKMLFDKGMNEFIKLNWGNVDEFKNFYKNLADPNKKNIRLNDVNVVTHPIITSGAIRIPIQKKIIEGPNTRLQNISN